MARSSVPLTARPAHDLPRERLLVHGAAALSDTELVAIQLGSGTRGTTAVELAGELLADFGGTGGLARAAIDELARHAGVGPAKACRLVAAFALADRAAGPGLSRVVRSSADVAEIAIPILGRARHEQVLLLVLDGGHRVRRVLTLSNGGATSSTMEVRDVLALALRHDAVGFAIVHNHPGGSLEPSAADVDITERLRQGAAGVGLRFLDHVIVAGERWRSLTAG